MFSRTAYRSGDGFHPIRVDSLPAGRVSEESNADAGTIADAAPAGRLDSPRSALIAALTVAVRDAASCGDLATARIALDALNRLLGDAVESDRTERTGGGDVSKR